MSGISHQRLAARHQHHGEHHDRRAQPRAEGAALDARGQLGARVRAATAAADLQQPMLGRHDGFGQLDDLVADPAPDDALRAGQLGPALATAIRAMLNGLIRIIDQPP